MLVSTILCCHDLDKNLIKSVKSILEQNFNDHELILLFDNPDKEKFSKLKKIITKENTKGINIVFLQNKINLGLTISLNKAIKISKGEFIMRHDSDDISEENRIFELVAYLRKNPDKNLVFSNVKVIDEFDNVIKLKVNYLLINNFFNSFNYRNSISHPSIMFRKKTFYEIKEYDERFFVSQDYDLIHKFIKNSRYSIGKVNKYLCKLRYSKDSISKKYNNYQHKNSIIIIFKNNFNLFQKKFDTMNSTDQMFLYIENTKKNIIQNAIYYSYMIDIKIPYRMIFNPIFLTLIFIRYTFHPNLLLKRLMKNKILSY